MAETTLGMIVDRVEYEVERGKIGEFSRATRTENAVHRDPVAAAAAGFERVPATLTHSVVAGHYRDQAGFVAALGLELSRIVVGSVKWKYLRPLAAGDSLRGVRTVVGDETRAGKRGGAMRVVTLETDYRDGAGDTVLTVQEVLIERGKNA
ncbi:MaoC family dehydratase N-terminal domain-containing protein [Nocardia sp. NPDC004860]|uniref:FAS1-like dehydratase domain-containing protein n=1 Tax=Nocardia sp. NPDC004860 TaxID=3154557 RepID=UPI0033BC6DD5